MRRKGRREKTLSPLDPFISLAVSLVGAACNAPLSRCVLLVGRDKKFLFPQSSAMLGAVERIGEGRNNLGGRNLLQTAHKKKRISLLCGVSSFCSCLATEGEGEKEEGEGRYAVLTPRKK